MGQTVLPSAVSQVTTILQGYADRAIFRGFGAGKVRGGKITYKMTWFKDHDFELIFDTKKRTLHFPMVLPKVPARSEMYKHFQRWLTERHSAELLDHRRVDPKKAKLSCAHLRGSISVTMTVRDRDYEYATRKLIHTVHEVFLSFVPDHYFEYMIEAFDLDPDRP